MPRMCSCFSRRGRARLRPQGLHRSSSRLLSAYVVLALLCLLLTFNFLSLVQRDVEVDCAIAGLWIRAQV